MFNCSSNYMPAAACLSLRQRRTAAWYLCRHGSRRVSPSRSFRRSYRSAKAFEAAEDEQSGRSGACRIPGEGGCDPRDYGKTGTGNGINEPSSIPELVMRPVPARSWTEWYTCLKSRSGALIDETIGSLIESVRLQASDSIPCVAADEPGQGGIIMINFNEPAAGFEAALFRRHLEKVAGKVHVIDGVFENKGSYPFFRNLAIEANGVVLGCGFSAVNSHERMRRVIEAHCKQNRIRYRRLNQRV